MVYREFKLHITTQLYMTKEQTVGGINSFMVFRTTQSFPKGKRATDIDISIKFLTGSVISDIEFA